MTCIVEPEAHEPSELKATFISLHSMSLQLRAMSAGVNNKLDLPCLAQHNIDPTP